MEFFDISPEVSESTAVYPGDQPFCRKVSLDCKQGDHLTLSSIYTTLHIGAHADAPSHYSREGEGIGSRAIEYYFGECQVIRVDNLRAGERVSPEHIKNYEILSRRVLFATGSFPNPNQWNNSFNSLSPELVRYLANKQVILVGIDTPSIDPADSKLLESHQEVFKQNIAILEGISLENVPEGKYQLVALPLKLKDADASPVRAILFK